MELSLYFTLLLLTSGYLTCAADDDGKTRCQGCRDLVEGILKVCMRTVLFLLSIFSQKVSQL